MVLDRISDWVVATGLSYSAIALSMSGYPFSLYHSLKNHSFFLLLF